MDSNISRLSGQGEAKPEQDGEQLRNSGWRSCHMDWSSPDTARGPMPPLSGKYKPLRALSHIISL